MCVNGQLFQQEMWEAVTFENVSGSYATLPTPNTMDHLPPRGLDSMIKQTQVHRKGRTKLANLREAMNPEAVKLFNELQQTQTTNSNNKGLEGFRREHELQESCGEEKARWSTQPYTLNLTGEDTTLNPQFG